MKLRSDDDIIRYDPVWIDLRGWELPVIARYVSWGVWLVITAVLVVPLHFFLGWLIGIVVAGMASGFIMYGYLAEKITNEVGLAAWIKMGLSEGRIVRAVARDANAAKKVKPLTCAVTNLTAAVAETEPIWTRVINRVRRKGDTA
jgi:hypothetical protein